MVRRSRALTIALLSPPPPPQGRKEAPILSIVLLIQSASCDAVHDRSVPGPCRRAVSKVRAR